MLQPASFIFSKAAEMLQPALFSRLLEVLAMLQPASFTFSKAAGNAPTNVIYILKGCQRSSNQRLVYERVASDGRDATNNNVVKVSIVKMSWTRLKGHVAWKMNRRECRCCLPLSREANTWLSQKNHCQSEDEIIWRFDAQRPISIAKTMTARIVLTDENGEAFASRDCNLHSALRTKPNFEWPWPLQLGVLDATSVYNENVTQLAKP